MRKSHGVRSARTTVGVFGKKAPGLCPCCGNMVDYLYRDQKDGIEKCYPCKKAGKGIQ